MNDTAPSLETLTPHATIGGHTAVSLVERFGSPLYVYNAETIRRQQARLAGAFSGARTRLLYACKANNNAAVIKLLHSLGVGVDAVSIYEVELALRCGIPANEVLFTPNCAPFSEIERAVELGVHINIDSLTALERFGQRYGAHPCAVRINPHIVAGGNAHIQTGHIDSKFGISIHQARHLQRIVKGYNMRVNGLHMHTGSDILDADAFLAGAEILFDLAADFPDLEFLDFGSGFKVPYRPGDVTTDVAALGARVTERFGEFCRERGSELELWFEPGKFLVSESGTLLVTVTGIKQTPSCVFAGVDSGLHQLLRPMLYDAWHTISNAGPVEPGHERIYTVVGCICETDTLGSDRRLGELREGDLLAIHNAGAYGYAMSSTYNSRPRPAEVLVDGDDVRLIRRRETLDDIMGLMV